MELTALLCWYREPPELLDGMVRSLPLAGVDRLVALDGGISLFPDAQPRSSRDESEAIQSAAEAVGIEALVVRPDEVWGTEMDKRTALFRHADSVTDWLADWVLVIDADEVIVSAPEDLKDQLAASSRDAAEVSLRDGPETAVARAWVEGSEADTIQQGRRIRVTRRLFRAIPGITVVENHFTYVAPDGRHLWGLHPVEAMPAFDLVLDHRSHLRPVARRKAASTYYDRRNVAQVEKHISRLARPMGIEREFV